MIKYIKGDVLKASNKRILIHSCNCYGSWGGGIAYQLALRYPQAEAEYVKICDEKGPSLLGQCVVIPSFEDENLMIGCLFTSVMGGGSHDAASEILEYTENALKNLKQQIDAGDKLKGYTLEMPKINSGIFGVPWERTEKVLKKFDSMQFTIYEL